MRVRLVDRYIGRVALAGIAGVWVVMTSLYVVFSLLSELRNAQADYGTEALVAEMNVAAARLARAAAT